MFESLNESDYNFKDFGTGFEPNDDELMSSPESKREVEDFDSEGEYDEDFVQPAS